jgi:hypothetical protein
MSKLLRLKEWVTLPEAAKHLTALLEEPVTVADLLQFALEGHLSLSVNLINHARAKLGRIFPFSEVPTMEVPAFPAPGVQEGSMLTMPKGIPMTEVTQLAADTPFLVFEPAVVSIDGLWDLAMRGAERIDIEYELQRELGGPDVELISEGTFLKRQDGTYASLQEQLRTYTTGPDGVKRRDPGDYYFPAGGLPKDCARVVRTAELQRLVRTITVPAGERLLETRERNTLLSIIVVLCGQAGYDIAKHAKTAGLIQDAASAMGIALGESTIEGHLRKAKEAVGTRMK